VTSDPRTRHVPVIVLSTRASDDEPLQGWHAGAHHYLTEPADVLALMGVVGVVVRNRVGSAPAAV
jgi:DNA-binding response OmpR family regulator